MRLYISVVDANSKKGQEEAHVGIAGSTKPRSTQSSESAARHARTHGWEGTGENKMWEGREEEGHVIATPQPVNKPLSFHRSCLSTRFSVFTAVFTLRRR